MSPPNGTLGNDSSLEPSSSVGYGRHFDRDGYAVNNGYQGRVIQVLWGPVLHQCGQALIRPTARADNVRTSTQRDPVQVERCRSGAEVGMAPLQLSPRRTCHKNYCDESPSDQLGTLFWASRDLLPNFWISGDTQWRIPDVPLRGRFVIGSFLPPAEAAAEPPAEAKAACRGRSGLSSSDSVSPGLNHLSSHKRVRAL